MLLHSRSILPIAASLALVAATASAEDRVPIDSQTELPATWKVADIAKGMHAKGTVHILGWQVVERPKGRVDRILALEIAKDGKQHRVATLERWPEGWCIPWICYHGLGIHEDAQTIDHRPTSRELALLMWAVKWDHLKDDDKLVESGWCEEIWENILCIKPPQPAAEK